MIANRRILTWLGTHWRLKMGLVWAGLWLCTNSFAQLQRSGKVLDAHSLLPLKGVSISVGAKPLTLTNVNGMFDITLPSDTLRVLFEAVGYREQSLKVGAASLLVVLLEPTNVQLPDLVVKGYASDRPQREVASPVGVLSPQALARFGNTSLLPALNTLPGVRMEERSPGSYRLSVRGSTLRSPFGVRNVKLYWDGIPLTDPSGNTYLNQLDLSNVGRIEVLKGPAGSLYGAGTGGTVLLESTNAQRHRLSATWGATLGSFGLRGVRLSVQSATQQHNSVIGYTRQEAEGYRQQTRMRREVLTLQTRLFADAKRTISVHAFYGDLYYQTPGGLTAAQYAANPRQARPAAGALRGAVEQQAAISLKTARLGLSHQYDFDTHWSNHTALYLSHTQAENLAIRNYERRIEPSLGGRSVTTYHTERSGIDYKVSVGVEFQAGIFTNQTFGNRLGAIDTLQTNDEIKVAGGLVFGQAELTLPSHWILTLGGSYNLLRYQFVRLNQRPVAWQRRSFEPVLSPRLALLKQLSPQLSTYASVSQGFSPPTIQEIRPSEGSFNKTLNPEQGTNYEIGLRGSHLHKRLHWELTAYALRLSETIVIRRAADGAEFFTNAGSTKQRGVEVSASGSPLTWLNVWAAYTLQDYRFGNYVSGTNDFSGKRLTGTPEHTLVSGLDLGKASGWYANITVQLTSKIPLNDANTVYAEAYQLLGLRWGYRLRTNRWTTDVFVAGDNLLNQRYTLGPDLNAVGGRFFNAAPPRNYIGGAQLSYAIRP